LLYAQVKHKHRLLLKGKKIELQYA